MENSELFEDLDSRNINHLVYPNIFCFIDTGKENEIHVDYLTYVRAQATNGNRFLRKLKKSQTYKGDLIPVMGAIIQDYSELSKDCHLLSTLGSPGNGWIFDQYQGCERDRALHIMQSRIENQYKD